jgi:hypothetical protein
MKEPRRLLDSADTSPEARELLRHARAPQRLDPEAFHRSRRRLLTAAALPAAAGTFLWVQHAALGAVLGLAVTVTATVIPRAFAPERASSAMTSNTAPAPTAPLAEPASITTSEPLNPTPAPPRSEPEPAPAPLVSNGPAPVESPAERLAREAKLLERARTSLRSSPGQALAILTDHERSFPDGALGPEREILAVDALVRLGRRNEAERRGRALTARFAGSLYEERLQRILSPDSGH